MSAVDEDVSVLAEADVELFGKARKACADWGVRLIDWLKTDAENFRTMAISGGGDKENFGLSPTAPSALDS